MSVLPIMIMPLSGTRIRSISSKIVVLPPPLGPTRPMKCPAGKAAENPLSAWPSPYEKVTSRKAMSPLRPGSGAVGESTSSGAANRVSSRSNELRMVCVPTYVWSTPRSAP